MPRLYHPDLGREVDAADDQQAAVLAESGWEPAPEPVHRPGYEPEPVKYAPVTDTTKKGSSKGRAAKAEPDEGEDTSK